MKLHSVLKSGKTQCNCNNVCMITSKFKINVFFLFFSSSQDPLFNKVNKSTNANFFPDFRALSRSRKLVKMFGWGMHKPCRRRPLLSTKRFMLDEIFQGKTSKFVIFLEPKYFLFILGNNFGLLTVMFLVYVDIRTLLKIQSCPK